MSVKKLLLILLLSSCNTKEEEFRICANRCSSASPWKVESLDLGLPCFSTQDACRDWANSHGYSGKPCVQCD